MENDPEIYNGKTFSSLVRDIYNNSSNKKDQINQLIKDLRTMVKDVGSATVMAPMIKDYIDVSVRNDEQLIKLSAVLQRFINGTKSEEGGGGAFGLSEKEKEQLLNNVREEIDEMAKHEIGVDQELEDLKNQVIDEDGIL